CSPDRIDRPRARLNNCARERSRFAWTAAEQRRARCERIDAEACADMSHTIFSFWSSLSRQACAARFFAWSALCVPVAIAGAANARSPQAIFAPGALVVPGFSGTPPQPAMIDFDSYSMRILRPVPNGPPQGRPIDAPPVFGVMAGQIGQVF